MKTWTAFHKTQNNHYNDVIITEEEYKQIQLDAFKAGMEYAAKQKNATVTQGDSEWCKGYNEATQDFERSIVESFYSLTELPK